MEKRGEGVMVQKNEPKTTFMGRFSELIIHDEGEMRIEVKPYGSSKTLIIIINQEDLSAGSYVQQLGQDKGISLFEN